MHGTFDPKGKRIKPADPTLKGSIAVVAMPTLIAFTMIALALTEPAASRWIAEAAQAEFAGFVSMPDIVPTQLAQPVGAMMAAKIN